MLADTPPCLGQLALLCLCPLAVTVAWLWMRVRDLLALQRSQAGERTQDEAALQQQMTEALLIVAHMQQTQVEHATRLGRLDGEIGDLDEALDTRDRQIKVLRQRQDQAAGHLKELALQHKELADAVVIRPSPARRVPS